MLYDLNVLAYLIKKKFGRNMFSIFKFLRLAWLALVLLKCVWYFKFFLVDSSLLYGPKLAIFNNTLLCICFLQVLLRDRVTDGAS